LLSNILRHETDCLRICVIDVPVTDNVGRMDRHAAGLLRGRWLYLTRIKQRRIEELMCVI
jgi:hypothetical protein